METTLVKTEDIAVEFAQGTRLKDIELLKALLSKDGTFQIQNEDLDIIEVDKQEFIKWYKDKLDSTTVTTIDYDQCILCATGNSVLLFNGGKFPRTIKDDSERSKAGLMLDIENGKIINTRFCFSLLKTENKYVIECRGEKVKEYVKQGLSTREAIAKAKAIATTDLY